MTPIKLTPPGPASGAQKRCGARNGRAHTPQYSREKLASKPTGEPGPKSRYSPGSNYRPPEEALARRQHEVLDLLKVRAAHGATRLDAPGHLSLSLSQRICELRQMGYRIDTVREQVGEVWIARYVLVATEPVPQGEAVP
ncbi:MAG: hypothetical protein IH994_01255 [Proteobacteria bacterium]|nr:hypothetical protein [Pseudomonadota bacterium]